MAHVRCITAASTVRVPFGECNESENPNVCLSLHLIPCAGVTSASTGGRIAIMPNRQLRTRKISTINKALSWYTNQGSINISIANPGKWCDITLSPEQLEDFIAELRLCAIDLGCAAEDIIRD